MYTVWHILYNCEIYRFYKWIYTDLQLLTMGDWSNGVCSCFNDCTICEFISTGYTYMRNCECVLLCRTAATLHTYAFIGTHMQVLVYVYNKVMCFSTGLMSFFCPWCQFGENAEAMGQNCSFGLAYCEWIPRLQIRLKLREEKGIDVSPGYTCHCASS